MLYFYYTPMANSVIHHSILGFILLPAFILLIYSIYVISTEQYFDRGWAGLGKSILFYLSNITGSIELFMTKIVFKKSIFLEEHETTGFMKIIGYNCFAFFEDLPQLVLQILNSLMLGQTMTYIQLFSPMTSLICLCVRPFNMDQRNYDYIQPFNGPKRVQYCLPVYFFIFVIYSAVVCMNIYMF